MTTTMARRPTGTLGAIATTMRQMIEGSNLRFAHRRLANGLELVLDRKDDRWRLALGRPDVAPSDHEIEICRAAFGVPVDTETKASRKERTNPKTNITLEWHVCEMTWMEA